MNFKDAYKNMADDIHGDRALLHSILNGETTKKKKHEFYFKPVFATALAAVFVMCIATIYQNTGIENYSPSIGSGDVKNSATSQVTDTASDMTIAPSISVEEGIGDEQTDKNTSEKPAVENKSSKQNNVNSESNTTRNSDAKSEKNGSTASESSKNIEVKNNAAVSTETAQNDVIVPMAQPDSEVTAKPEPKANAVTEADAGESSESDVSEAAMVKEFEDMLGAYSVPMENVRSYDEEPQGYASSGGSSAASSAPSVSNVDVPDDMNFGDGVAYDENSTIYTAVSENDPDRQIIIVVSDKSDMQNDFPDAHHIQTEDKYISVIAENVTQEEINAVIDSLD